MGLEAHLARRAESNRLAAPLKDLFWAVVTLGPTALVIWVLWHFISKYW